MTPHTNREHLQHAMRGTWWLLSREDYTKSGKKKTDPILGADPLGILVYAPDHFAAQFMKRDRIPDHINQSHAAGTNNTAAVGGYDAYFGTYAIDPQTNLVAHTLTGSINPANIGITVLRKLQVQDDQLIIRMDTSTPDGEPIERTLTWKRIG